MRSEKMLEKTGFVVSVTIRKNNVTPAMARCEPDFTSRKRRFDSLRFLTADQKNFEQASSSHLRPPIFRQCSTVPSHVISTLKYI
jgi:hypothetical protein